MKGIPLLVLLVCMLSGCGTDILGSDPNTGISVAVRKGPIEPVGREGEDNSLPVPGAWVTVEGRSGGDVSLKTNTQGRLTVLLEPGDYLVTVRECPGTLGLPEPREATVESGRMVELALECDTGIRLPAPSGLVRTEGSSSPSP